MTEQPEGTVNNQLAALVEAAKTKEIPFYIIIGSGSNIRRGILRRKLTNESAWTGTMLHYSTLSGQSKSVEPSLEDRTCLFTNFWHAYAYAIKIGAPIQLEDNP